MRVVLVVRKLIFNLSQLNNLYHLVINNKCLIVQRAKMSLILGRV